MNHAEPWEQRRRTLSHDFFKNPRNLLGKWRNVLDLSVVDHNFTSKAALGLLASWASSGKPECLRLAESYVIEMSPRLLFARPPLDGCGATTRSWLAPVIHDLWLVRRQPQVAVSRLTAAIAAADSAYVALVDAAKFHVVDSPETRAQLDSCIERLEVGFADLNDVLSAFPKVIQVV